MRVWLQVRRRYNAVLDENRKLKEDQSVLLTSLKTREERVKQLEEKEVEVQEEKGVKVLEDKDEKPLEEKDNKGLKDKYYMEEDASTMSDLAKQLQHVRSHSQLCKHRMKTCAGLQVQNISFYMYVCISYNTGKSALLDIYARRPRHAAPEGKCIYIRQSMSACVISNIIHFWHS